MKVLPYQCTKERAYEYLRKLRAERAMLADFKSIEYFEGYAPCFAAKGTWNVNYTMEVGVEQGHTRDGKPIYHWQVVSGAEADSKVFITYAGDGLPAEAVRWVIEEADFEKAMECPVASAYQPVAKSKDTVLADLRYQMDQRISLHVQCKARNTRHELWSGIKELGDPVTVLVPVQGFMLDGQAVYVFSDGSGLLCRIKSCRVKLRKMWMGGTPSLLSILLWLLGALNLGIAFSGVLTGLIFWAIWAKCLESAWRHRAQEQRA